MKAQLRLLLVIFVVTVVVFLVNCIAYAEDHWDSLLSDSAFRENMGSLLGNEPPKDSAAAKNWHTLKALLNTARENDTTVDFVSDSLLPVLYRHRDNMFSIGIASFKRGDDLTGLASLIIIGYLNEAELFIYNYSFLCATIPDCIDIRLCHCLWFNLRGLERIPRRIQHELVNCPQGNLLAVQGNDAKKDLEQMVKTLKALIPAESKEFIMYNWDQLSRIRKEL